MRVMEKIKRRIRMFLPHNIKWVTTTKINRGGASLRLIKTYVFDNGKKNTIVIGEGSTLNRCVFRFFGDANRIFIGNNCHLNDVTFWIEDSKNEISIGEETTINGKTEIAAIEGTKVTIGGDCMFSSNIHMRTGDSHSVVDLSGKRINPSKNISVGNHVWVGQNVFVGKGVVISDNSIVGACSVVTRQFFSGNIAIAGNPAAQIKNNVNWKRVRG